MPTPVHTLMNALLTMSELLGAALISFLTGCEVVTCPAMPDAVTLNSLTRLPTA